MTAYVTPVGWSLPVMVGLPDDSLVPLISDGSRLFWSVPGNTSFPSQLAPQFQHRLAQVFFGPNIRLEPVDLLRAIEHLGLAFPLIVRLAGAHNGSTTVRIEHADDIRYALKQVAWGGRGLYATEYVDYRDGDGRYRKLRPVVVGSEYFIRHLIVADEWHIHAQRRDAEAADEEMATIADFHVAMLPKIRDTLDAVREAMGLDYFGIDCSLRPDGRLLLFEANTAMNILHNSAPSPNYRDAPIERIRDALTSLLFDPARWRHPHESLRRHDPCLRRNLAC